MPDATEWLVNHVDDDGEQYSRIADREDAIAYLRQLVLRGKAAALYQRVSFEVDVEVTVKAPRRRRKNSPPALEPASASPTGPGNGEAGEPKGAASPNATEAKGADTSDAPARSPIAAGMSNPASPVFPWTCEARFDGDPDCLGQVWPDPATHGHFCEFHV
jgi:hypothetical protein